MLRSEKKVYERLLVPTCQLLPGCKAFLGIMVKGATFVLKMLRVAVKQFNISGWWRHWPSGTITLRPFWECKNYKVHVKDIQYLIPNMLCINNIWD